MGGLSKPCPLSRGWNKVLEDDKRHKMAPPLPENLQSCEGSGGRGDEQRERN